MRNIYLSTATIILMFLCSVQAVNAQQNTPSLYRWSKNVDKENDPSLTDNDVVYSVDSVGNVTATSHVTSSRSWNIQLIVRFTAKENTRYNIIFNCTSEINEERIGFEKNNIDIFFGTNPSEQNSVRTNFDCGESPGTFNYILPEKVNIDDELMVHFNIAKSTGTFYIKNLSIVPEGLSDINLYVGGYYEIHTPDQLNDIRTDLAGSYILTADISLSSYDNWEPIGSRDSPFTGKIDGSGYKITGLKINRKTADIVGLFGNVVGGTINNLSLENINVAGKNATGGIAGIIKDTTITNSYSKGTVSAENAYSGGIVGQALNSRITNSYSTSIVTGQGPSGGITGLLLESAIINSFSSGYVGARNPSGGMVGIADRGTITNCYSTGNVSVTNGPSGGIVGQMRNSTISNCYSTGVLNLPVIIGGSEFPPPGGIAGCADGNSKITNNAAINRMINATNGADRIVGSYMNTATITNNFALETMEARGAAKFSNDMDKKSHGISRSNARLKEQSTYSGGLGWKFGDDDAAPWKMPANSDYPVLYWQ